MPRLLFVVFLLFGCTSTAFAQRYASSYSAEYQPEKWVTVPPRVEAPPLFAPDDKVRLIGVTLLLGLPDCIAPGISFHPWTNLVHIDLSLSGLLSLGVRGGVTFDPFDWVVAPTLTFAMGYNGWADLPFSDRSIRFDTTYLNVQAGIEVGRRSRFRIFLRVGYSHLWVDTDYWPSYSGKQATSSTKVEVNVVPSLNLGLTGYL